MSPASPTSRARDAPGHSPPEVVVAVKALACELPNETGLPLSRMSCADIRREALRRGIVAEVGGATIWRWLHEDAIRPWTHRSWIFPRDPRFAEKAAPILDLYQGRCEGVPLGDRDFVLCADEKPSIQARRRIHPPAPPAPGRAVRVEHEYERRGALTYIAAWDVHRAKVFGVCAPRSGIVHFDRLVSDVMSRPPYNRASRVFWIVDNASVHRGQSCADRFARQWPNTRVVHTPVHASWLNQVEVYFSIVQRKALAPNDFQDLEQVQRRLHDFERYFEQVAKPFKWKFTRQDLDNVLNRLSSAQPQPRIAA